jgi:glycosyltransferase involved in cell wall biosynthesis
MSAVLGNSRAVAVELRAEGVRADRLGIIYNGIDAAPFRQGAGKPEAKTALGLSPTTLVMTIVANLIGYKGHADLFDALALAKPRLPADWKLLVVGRDDGIGAALRERAAAGGIADNVVFLGPRRDVPALYAASDIGLLVSHEEGFSNAVLEGMAAGLPMIVSDVGGNPEAVLDGESGLVVPARNPQRLAEAIVRLASDPTLRTRLGTAAAGRIAQNFTIEHCAARYDALYRTLTTGGALQEVPAVAVGPR